MSNFKISRCLINNVTVKGSMKMSNIFREDYTNIIKSRYKESDNLTD